MSAHEQYDHFVSPFEGEPHTELFMDDQNGMTFIVRPNELSARGAKFADSLTGFCVFVIWSFSVYSLLLAQPEGLVPWIIGIFGPLMIKPLLRGFWQKVMRRESHLIFTPDTFKFRRKGRWTSFNRELTHQFAMLPHDKARDESEARYRRTMRAQRNGNDITPKRYYEDSFHIVFYYMGQRYDLLDIYDRKRASAVLGRLNACDEVMNARANLGGGEVLSPEDQWGQGPGALPNSTSTH